MMAPRTQVFGSIFTQSEPTKDQLISDLQSEVRRYQQLLVDEQRERAMAEANAARLRRNAGKTQVVPMGDCEQGYECPNLGCHVPLVEDFAFCPGCGCEIAWKAPRTVYDSDAYDRRFDR